MIPEEADVFESQTVKLKVGCGSMFVTVTFMDGKVCGIFGHLGKAGGCELGFIEGLCRVISVGLRSGIPPEDLFKQLVGIQCPKPVKFGKRDGVMDPQFMSCVDAIAKVLRKFSVGEVIQGEHVSKAEEQKGAEEG